MMRLNRTSRDPLHQDTDLQPEHTSISWAHTCLALFGLILVQLRLTS
ncbi:MULTISPECIES: hypothetical protein [unclassified Rothia (in: high G+C Gram-positive bacteria)]|nr:MULTISPECIES: hypothetical protein [unclassified Rothia (in: high G+C Gram-positive bacteria)]MBM7051550.1 hypothetical protein [Rothia sp. ZJ1223]QRZ61858.1 hypothetical protein JR346_01585 [Rothia sp. ZJ932]